MAMRKINLERKVLWWELYLTTLVMYESAGDTLRLFLTVLLKCRSGKTSGTNMTG